ncbi:metallophosphoesterase family protein [Nocardioides sediminis]|uniref:metallophosphoesterase family protein n=1 Tax=Nocardioides sediminis TaxID=433648 RepID=UPI001F37D9F3|nr:metallophosphoesterase [Nocardioides sediminis]
MSRTRLASTALVAVGSLVVAVVAGVTLFLSGSRTVVVASHDATVRPTLDGDVVVRTGPLLPDVRRQGDGPVGVDMVLGKTEASSADELIARYAFIASQPESQVDKVQAAVEDIAISAAVRGLGLGLVPLAVWLLLGPHRRGELFRGLRTRRGAVGAVLLVALPLALWQPWDADADRQEDEQDWITLGEFLGSAVPLPVEADGIEVRTGPTTTQTRRLIASAVSTYDKSKAFYAEAAETAADLDVRVPEEGETVALLVSDRHDNIGMDPVARAVGDAAGATVVLDAGDDTSTGQPWEAFSLDSLDRAFGDLDRFVVAGNHDHGEFVIGYLADLGWTTLDGEAVEGPGGGLILGVDDPRSSGLGDWRDESGLSFGEVEGRLAEVACESEDRISTMLVHDANLGREALARGCVDLVVGGHTHVQRGPEAVVGEEGRIGWTYTNGTTGGAAYAIAVGSKPRRDAGMSLVTYDEEGRPVGVQGIRLQTDGTFVVGEYAPLTYE